MSFAALIVPQEYRTRAPFEGATPPGRINSMMTWLDTVAMSTELFDPIPNPRLIAIGVTTYTLTCLEFGNCCFLLQNKNYRKRERGEERDSERRKVGSCCPYPT